MKKPRIKRHVTIYEKLLRAIGCTDVIALLPMHIPEEPTAAQLLEIISLPDVSFMAFTAGHLYCIRHEGHCDIRTGGDGFSIDVTSHYAPRYWWFFQKKRVQRVMKVLCKHPK
jgi:hypothetical protein